MRRTLPDVATASVGLSRLRPAATPDAAPGRLRLEEHLVSLVSPGSFEADQYRVLRRLLEKARAETGLTVLAVTSAAAGDGKTTTAINLAATLTQLPGTRVLLVDADLRRPFVATKLGLENGPGLGEAVQDDRLDLAAVVVPTPFHLDVVPAGPPPAVVHEVLDSPRVGQLLQEARTAYDYVVLDTPPVLLVPDCRLMSQLVDGFVVVVAAHSTPRSLLGEALGALDPAKVLGIIFNGDDRPLSGHYKQYYGHYYRGRAAREHRRRWWPWRRRGLGRPEPWS